MLLRLLDKAQKDLDELRHQIEDLSKECSVYRATLRHIAQKGRCSNPQNCAEEALVGDWKQKDVI